MTRLSPLPLGRRDLLRLTAGACGGLALDGLPSKAFAAAPELRIADYKALDQLSLSAAGALDSPHKNVFSEFASGNLIVEALNAGSIDVGSSSEIPPPSASRRAPGCPSSPSSRTT